MTGRALLLASALVAALAALLARTAGAANWLEMDFYLSGPQYEGKLPPCDYRDALVKIASRFNQRENMYWATSSWVTRHRRIVLIDRLYRAELFFTARVVKQN